jgi:hypothetical protein
MGIERMVQRLVLLLCAAGAYAVGFWPTWWLRDAVLHAFGNPAYEGVWILIPHALLYSTLGALVCLALWLAFVRAKWLPPIPLALSRAAAVWGVVGAIVGAAVTFGFLAATQPGAIGHPSRASASNFDFSLALT